MTIKEIEELSGLSRANVRYYEDEGMIQPKREKMDTVIIRKKICRY